MKILLVISLLLPAAAQASQFGLERLSAAGVRPEGAPLPPAPSRAVRADVPTAAWIQEVKREYLANPIGTLPPAELSELPPQALQQLQWDAQTYPSRAYKIVLDGRAAYVIENDNNDALYVNLFDETGLHIGYGGYDENYDFYWLSKKAR